MADETRRRRVSEQIKEETAALLQARVADPRLAGITLTENCAMHPAASVSGWYFGDPAAAYFGLGRIGRDQVEDYARRKGWSVAEAERWLAPNLGYEPSAVRPQASGLGGDARRGDAA